MAALLWTNVSSLFIWNLFKSVSVYLNCIGSSRVGNGNGGILEIPPDRVQQPGVCAWGCQVAEPDPLTNSTLNAAFVCYNRSRCYLWIDWTVTDWSDVCFRFRVDLVGAIMWKGRRLLRFDWVSNSGAQDAQNWKRFDLVRLERNNNNNNNKIIK